MHTGCTSLSDTSDLINVGEVDGTVVIDRVGPRFAQRARLIIALAAAVAADDVSIATADTADGNFEPVECDLGDPIDGFAVVELKDCGRYVQLTIENGPGQVLVERYNASNNQGLDAIHDGVSVCRPSCCGDEPAPAQA